MEEATGKRFSLEDRDRYTRGATELDLVDSGLEETMILAYQQMREIKHQQCGKADLRIAALMNAIDKIAIAYEELGLFP